MTITIYEMHSDAAHFCTAARDALRHSAPMGKIEAIGYLVLARASCLAASLKSCSDILCGTTKHIVKLLVIPLLDDLSLATAIRMCVAVALVITVTALRIISSLGGVVSPELTFGILRLHRLLLRLGLICRSQFAYVGTLPALLSPLQSRINEQRWRWGIASYALRRIDEEESRGETIRRMGFAERIWEPAQEQALRDELDLLVREFQLPVAISHPLLETFQQRFVQSLRREARAVWEQGLYTKDEVEDMITAFSPLVNRATYQTIVELFKVTETAIPLGSRAVVVTQVALQDGRIMVLKDVLLSDNKAATVKETPVVNGQRIRSIASAVAVGDVRTLEHRYLRDGEGIAIDDLSLANGSPVVGGDAGGLDGWKEQLIEILMLINAMTASARDALLYYLCADEERMRRVRPDLPPVSADPVLDRCFKLIVGFSTTFVAHHMPTDAHAVMEAFTIQAS